jgi:hypothetical protein
MKIILVQGIFLVLVLGLIYYMYPRTQVDVKADWVNFNSINAKVIMISENPDLSNPRYIEIEPGKKLSYELYPGTYYYKSDNGIIQGLKNEFKIDSRVGLNLKDKGNQSDLVNVGNVRINVTRARNGMMVGHIILEDGGEEAIENLEKNEEYIGRQE